MRRFGLAALAAAALSGCVDGDGSPTGPCLERNSFGRCIVFGTPEPLPDPTPTPAPTPVPLPPGPCPFSVAVLPVANRPGLFRVFTMPQGPTQWVIAGVNIPDPLGLLEVTAGTVVTACRYPCGCLYPFPVF